MTPVAPRERAVQSNVIDVFHALSDETRLAVVEMLGGGERCVCDLQDALDAAQSRLSFHLKVLKDAGIVTDRKEGRWSYYSLNTDRLAEAGEVLNGFAAAVPSSGAPALHRLARRTRVAERVAEPSKGARGGCC